MSELLVGMVTAPTVMEVCVGEPLTAGAPLTAAPLPLATALAVTMPDTTVTALAPVKFPAGKDAGNVNEVEAGLCVVGEPVMATVTTVLLVRVTVPVDNPGGRLVANVVVKSPSVILAAYVSLARV